MNHNQINHEFTSPFPQTLFVFCFVIPISHLSHDLQGDEARFGCSNREVNGSGAIFGNANATDLVVVVVAYQRRRRIAHFTAGSKEVVNTLHICVFISLSTKLKNIS